LSAGDKVVVDGVMKIGPGAPVRIADPNKANAAPKGAPGAPAKGDGKSVDGKPAAAAPAKG
jgi:membrane fusion protein (multidrug efflux system)